jgi:Fur family transcriptional regulator, ferric uptake regulator
MEAVEILRKNNIKVTEGRKKVLEILISEEKAISADYINYVCASEGLDINLSTIYRNLEVFHEKKLVEKFHSGGDKFSYIFMRHSHKHVMECSLCNKEVEVDCPIKQVEEIIKSKTGFIMLEHQFHMKGICSDCSREKEE